MSDYDCILNCEHIGEAYQQGRTDLIKQFDDDDSPYLIISAKEYGEYYPSIYTLEEIEKKLKEQNN